MQMNGRTALITGGSSGIGLATAKLLAEHGVRIAITGLEKEKLEMAGLQIGPGTIALRVDVRSLSDLTAMRESLGRQFDRLDILFVNAGVAFGTPVQGTDETAYSALMDVNVKGVFFTVQAALPLMASGSVIILNTSWLNRVGTPGLSLLSASKAAVRSFARTLSAELLPRGIRVNAVSPGAIDTPIRTRRASAEEARMANEKLAARIPLKRLGEARDIASAVLYLASDSSRYVVGTELVVDGGFSEL